MLVDERAQLKTDRDWLAEVQKKLEEAQKKLDASFAHPPPRPIPSATSIWIPRLERKVSTPKREIRKPMLPRVKASLILGRSLIFH